MFSPSFEALVEREWVQAGHPFWSRTTKGPYNDSVASKSKSYAPTFTIFLDCVWQVHNNSITNALHYNIDLNPLYTGPPAVPLLFRVH